MTPHRRDLLRLLAYSGTLLSAGCDALSNRNGEGVLDFSRPWNDPENLAAARRQPQATHLADLYFRGPALSPDGAFMAVTLPSSPVNELAIINIASRSGWVLAHPNNLVKLAHPSFSPDGRHVAVVVTPPTYFGASEIWIAPVEGGQSEIVSERPMGCFMLPQFSHDGQRLVCFGDANQAVPDERPHMRPYRTGIVQLALYEIDLRTGAKARLASQAWGWAHLVAYGPREDGFYLNTGLPSRLVSTARGEIWEPTSDIGDGTDYGRRCYFVSRGEEPLFSPRSAAPEQILRISNTASLVGVGAAGELLISTTRPTSKLRAGSTSALVLCTGDRCIDMIAPDDAQTQEAALSRDAQTAAGRVVRALVAGAEDMTSAFVHRYLVRSRGDLHGFTAPDEIHFEERRRFIVADGPSELAS